MLWVRTPFMTRCTRYNIMWNTEIYKWIKIKYFTQWNKKVYFTGMSHYQCHHNRKYSASDKGRRDRIIVGFTTTCAISAFTTNVVSSNPIHDEVYSIQHHVIKFVSYLRQVSGFLRVFVRLFSFYNDYEILSCTIQTDSILHSEDFSWIILHRCPWNTEIYKWIKIKYFYIIFVVTHNHVCLYFNNHLECWPPLPFLPQKP
jgi:hypothetical protein